MGRADSELAAVRRPGITSGICGKPISEVVAPAAAPWAAALTPVPAAAMEPIWKFVAESLSAAGNAAEVEVGWTTAGSDGDGVLDGTGGHNAGGQGVPGRGRINPAAETSPAVGGGVACCADAVLAMPTSASKLVHFHDWRAICFSLSLIALTTVSIQNFL
jgi:hypothetical protein